MLLSEAEVNAYFLNCIYKEICAYFWLIYYLQPREFMFTKQEKDQSNISYAGS